MFHILSYKSYPQLWFKLNVLASCALCAHFVQNILKTRKLSSIKDRGQTDRILTLTCDLQFQYLRALVVTHTHTHTHTHTTVLLLFWSMSGTNRVSRYQKGKTRKVKTNLDLLEQEIVSGSGICWAIGKSTPHPRQPRQHPTTQVFTGRMPFLPPNQQRQSTDGSTCKRSKTKVSRFKR